MTTQNTAQVTSEKIKINGFETLITNSAFQSLTIQHQRDLLDICFENIQLDENTLEVYNSCTSEWKQLISKCINSLILTKYDDYVR